MGGEMKVQSTPGVGSVFRLRLFLPHVHEVPAASVRRVSAPMARVRRGYEGPCRRLLVVDNEEADRELLAHVLTPLGFELRTAASGHDALDLIAAGWRPHAMFVDLAMPGIDGWETIRRSRSLGLTEAAVAIVSANAFDKRLDNDVGIAPEDFFVKPVRHSELLDWLERRLGLRWNDQPVALPASEPAAAAVPSAERLRALEEAVSLGYFRGIMNQLDDIDAAQPECAAWTAAQRALARQFQFEAMSRALTAAVGTS
jgi:CheY-like chemotaxis protein